MRCWRSAIQRRRCNDDRPCYDSSKHSAHRAAALAAQGAESASAPRHVGEFASIATCARRLRSGLKIFFYERFEVVAFRTIRKRLVPLKKVREGLGSG